MNYNDKNVYFQRSFYQILIIIEYILTLSLSKCGLNGPRISFHFQISLIQLITLTINL